MDVWQEISPNAPNIFLFPGDEGYEGDEYEERARQKSGASRNGTGWLNNLGADEVNADLQQMNNSQSEGAAYEDECKDNEEDKEEEEGTNTAEFDKETPEETDQNKKRKANDDNGNKKERQVNH